MTQTYTTTINAAGLETLLDTNTPLRIFDCRARLGDPGQGAVLFAEGHIAGALHADLDTDLAAPPSDQGRHPLPAFNVWLARVKQWGLQDHELSLIHI